MKDDIGFMCEYFVLPHITDPDTQQNYKQLSDNNGKLPILKTFPG